MWLICKHARTAKRCSNYLTQYKFSKRDLSINKLEVGKQRGPLPLQTIEYRLACNQQSPALTAHCRSLKQNGTNPLDL